MNKKLSRIYSVRLVWLAAGLVLLAGLMRYLQQPTFWLDEAFVAVSLRSPTPETIFAPLEYGQLFPRIYLGLIALLRESLGYHFWVIRLLPFLCFITATIFWTRLLSEKARSFLATNILAFALLIGSFFWIEQGSNLKQYTFDVMLALIPFLIRDDSLEDALLDGRRKWLLMLLAVPCWVFHRPGWRRIHLPSLAVFLTSIATAMIVIWLTDYRFNYRESVFYYGYWDSCILSSCISNGPASTLSLLAKFFWGWHRSLGVIGVIEAPFQILGLISIFRQLRRRWANSKGTTSDSRSLGSVAVLCGVIAASLAAKYPMCAGRLTLFTLIHIQILAIEGMLVVVAVIRRRRRVLIGLYSILVLFTVLNGIAYYRIIASEPPHDLRPVYKLIDPNVSDLLWVNSCSVAQVRSLEKPLPVNEVLLGMDKHPAHGQKAWVLWTHLREERCKADLEHMQSEALSWQVVSENENHGLALAEF